MPKERPSIGHQLDIPDLPEKDEVQNGILNIWTTDVLKRLAFDNFAWTFAQMPEGDNKAMLRSHIGPEPRLIEMEKALSPQGLRTVTAIEIKQALSDIFYDDKEPDELVLAKIHYAFKSLLADHGFKNLYDCKRAEAHLVLRRMRRDRLEPDEQADKYKEVLYTGLPESPRGSNRRFRALMSGGWDVQFGVKSELGGPRKITSVTNIRVAEILYPNDKSMAEFFDAAKYSIKIDLESQYGIRSYHDLIFREDVSNQDLHNLIFQCLGGSNANFYLFVKGPAAMFADKGYKQWLLDKLDGDTQTTQEMQRKVLADFIYGDMRH